MNDVRPSSLPRIDWIRQCLRQHEPRRLPNPAQLTSRAAVALVFAGAPKSLSLAFIERAQRPGDPWSGQMAFPGGRTHRADVDSRATAERETYEEVGISLEVAQYLGPLDELPMHRAGLNSDSVIAPHVYCLDEPVDFVLDQREVASAHWISLEHLWDPDHCTTFVWGTEFVFPAIRHGSGEIWGLSYRILSRLSHLLGHPLPASVAEPEL